MIISRTPFRISFAGGGSDLREHYKEYGGAVLSVTINKYIYLSMHPYFEKDNYFLKYSEIEKVSSVDKIKHNIIRETFKEYNIKGVDFNSSADIPSGTGLGSSSAFTVGLTNLCSTYNKKHCNKEYLADKACDIEIDKLKCPIGKQDQYASAYGGLNYIIFNQDDSVTVNSIKLDKRNKNKLENNLLLFYLGNVRSANKVLEGYEINHNNLSKMVDLAKMLNSALSVGNIDSIGDVLHTGWMYKKELPSEISNTEIDYYYNLSIKNGADGGKLLGAGGGGFLLLYVKEENQEQLRRSLIDLKEVDFKFEGKGASIIYDDNNR